MRDGWGVELRHHGERYEGEWRNGFREGLGVLTCANSQRAPLASEETGRFVRSFFCDHIISHIYIYVYSYIYSYIHICLILY